MKDDRVDYNRFWSPVFDDMSDFVCLVDCDHNLARANESFSKVFGGDEKKLIGKKGEFYEPGLKKYFSVAVTPIWDDERKLVGSIYVARDVTQLKEEGEQLKIRNDFIDKSMTPFAVGDLDGKLLYANAACLKMWGYASGKEVMGRSIIEFWKDEEKNAEIVKAYIKKKDWTGELTAKRKDGTTFNCHVVTSVIADNRGRPLHIVSSFADVTAHNLMAKALNESEEKYKALVECSQEGIGFVDPHENIRFTNDSFAKMLGYKVGELVDRNLKTLTSAEEFEKYRGETRKRRRGKKGRYETFLYHKDGSPRFVSVSASPLMDHDGNFSGTLGVVSDITKLKSAQDEIVVAKKYADNIIKSMIDAMVVIDPDARIKTLNLAALEMLGYKEEELIGKPVGMILEEEEEEEEEGSPFKGTRFKKLLKKGFITNSEMIWRSKSGGRVPVNFSGSAMKDGDGKLVGIVAVARDMREKKATAIERKKTAKLLEFYREYAENIVGHLPVSLIVVNRDLRINFANQHFLSKMRTTKENVTEKEIAKVLGKSIVESSTLDKEIMRVIRGEEARVEGRFILKAKTYNYMIVPIREQTGRRLNALLVMEDVTKNVMMEEQLIHSEKLSAVGTFTASVVHEINNPLSIVVGNIQYLLSNLHHMNLTKKKVVGEIVETLKTANSEAKRCSEIVTNLLHFSHKGRSEKTKISVNGVVTSTMRLLAHQLELSKVKTHIKLADDLPRVMGNADHLQQAFVNLILNAGQVMKEGGRLYVTTSLADNYVAVSFKDTGPGIPKKYIRKIFEPFYSTREEGKGTGLGLFIIHSIMEEHGGKVEVQSKRGQGATFTLKLPVAEKNGFFS